MQIIIDNFAAILTSTVSMSIPFMFAAIGGLFSVRSGIMALGLESMMMAGAFMAVLGSFLSGSAAVGLLCGIAGGMLLGFLHGVLCIRYRVNQVISGIGLNLVATAATTLTMQLVWNNRGSSPQVANLTAKLGSSVSWIPLLGPILEKQSVLFGVLLLTAVLAYFLITRTKYGLRMRMVGENPAAAASLGLNVHGIKYIGVLICGALAGLGGTYLSLDNLNMFVRNMTAGRGYIAVVIMILARYNPFSVLLCALAFGFCDAVQIYLQGQGVPSQLIQMIPYIVTLLILTFGVQNIRPPAGVGKYETDEC